MLLHLLLPDFLSHVTIRDSTKNEVHIDVNKHHGDQGLIWFSPQLKTLRKCSRIGQDLLAGERVARTARRGPLRLVWQNHHSHTAPGTFQRTCFSAWLRIREGHVAAVWWLQGTGEHWFQTQEGPGRSSTEPEACASASLRAPPRSKDTWSLSTQRKGREGRPSAACASGPRSDRVALLVARVQATKRRCASLVCSY